MTLLQAAPMIGTTKPSSSVPESSDRYAQLLTAGNFEIILTLEKIFVRALCTIISLIVHKKNITQTDDHQFPCELFQSCSHDTFAFEMGFSLEPLCHTKRHDKYVFTTHPPHKELFIWEKSSHPGEPSHLSEISAEWCISLYQSKSFIREWIYLTQLRTHVNAGEISLRWDNFSPCKQCLLGCPT